MDAANGHNIAGVAHPLDRSQTRLFLRLKRQYRYAIFRQRIVVPMLIVQPREDP